MRKSTSSPSSSQAAKKRRTVITELDIYRAAPGNYSPRSFLESGRWALHYLPQLSRLTLAEFRAHLSTGLKDLQITDENKQALLQSLGPLPTEDAFWKILQDLDHNYRLEQETDSFLTQLRLKYHPSVESWFGQFHQAYVTIKTIPWQELPLDSYYYQNKQDDFNPMDTRWDVLFHTAFVRAYDKSPPADWEEAASKVWGQFHWLREKARRHCRLRSEHLERLWKGGKTLGLLTAVREGFFSEGWVAQALSTLQWQQARGETKEQQKQAAEILKRAGTALGEVVSGNQEQANPQEKRKIIEDCEKWKPICKGLNTDFKRLRKESLYANSELSRKEASGMLATKFSISEEDVNAIESYLYPDPERSSRGPKDTPWNAMLRIVALKNPEAQLPRGVKTIEAIYRAGRNAYLEEKKTQGNSVTNPSVDERTA